MQLSPLCLLGLQLVLQRCLRPQCPNPSPCLCADLPLPEGAPGVVPAWYWQKLFNHQVKCLTNTTQAVSPIPDVQFQE